MRKRIFAVILLVILLALGLYGWSLVRRGFSAREEPSSLESFAARMARTLAIPPSYRGLRNPVPPTGENLRDGLEHFADHCAVCHANGGSGDTLFGTGLYPKPPEMRKAETQNKSDGELYYVIVNGVRLSGMPAFGDSSNISDSDRL